MSSNSPTKRASLGESKHRALSKSIPGPCRFLRVDRRTGVRCSLLFWLVSGVAGKCLLMAMCSAQAESVGSITQALKMYSLVYVSANVCETASYV